MPGGYQVRGGGGRGCAIHCYGELTEGNMDGGPYDGNSTWLWSQVKGGGIGKFKGLWTGI